MFQNRRAKILRQDTRKVFGIKYRNQAAYDKARQDYLTFKNSLTQYAD